MELENQLLKCDVSNRQKFVDTILEPNYKLSHNIDVTPASSTTCGHHVTREQQHIRGNQNGETSDTEHYDRQKHDYNLNRENGKSDDSNKEKKLKQDNLHYVKSVQIRSFSGPYFPTFGLNTGKYGAEKTPYLEAFQAELPAATNNKNIYILGDSVVKDVERWKFKNSLGNYHIVYVRGFPGAKVKCMKYYVKPCIRENNPENVILHVGTKELNS